MKKIVIFIVALFALFGCRFKASGVGTDVTVAEAKALVEKNRDNPDFMILDVRTPAEYNIGHIEGAVNIDIMAPGFEDKLAALDKSRIYLVYCRAGNRSAQAIKIMKTAGFTKIYHMMEGYSKWK